MSLLLSAEERQRFAEWLEHEATTGKGLLEQIEKLGPGMQMLADRERGDIAAALRIARKLRQTESFSVNSKPV